MKNTFQLLMRCFVAALMLISTNAFAQDNTIRHNVKAGETIYSISTKYGIDANDLMKANPGLTAQTLKAGKDIIIPSEDYFKQSGCKEMHKVKRKETLWGIAHDYGITVDELAKANPEISSPGFKLKKGTFLCIPYPATNSTTTPAKPATESKAITAHPLPRLSVALVLPLRGNGVEVKRSVEFTRGFLMAVKSMKETGKDIDVFIHNESPDGKGMSEALAASAKHNVQLIVGPLYPSHFGQVARWAKNNGAKCLIPFSSKAEEVESIPNVYLLNAPENHKAEFAASLFSATFKKPVKALFIQTKGGNERGFQTDLRRMLVEKGYEAATLAEGFTQTQLASSLDASGTTVIIPDASTREGAVQASQIVARLRAAHPSKAIALMGYPEWQEMAKGIRPDLHSANTYIVSNFFYNPYSDLTKAFENEYKAWFSTPLLDFYPRMAMLGYDAGIDFMYGLLTYGMEFSTQEVDKISYQSDIHYVKNGSKGGYVNDCVQFIHYRPDNIIEKIAPK